MSVTLANVLVSLLGLYAAVGLVFAFPFVLRGVNAADPVARDGSWGFRLIIIPGVVALWPVLALRWIHKAPPPEENNAHRRASRRSGAS